MPTFREHGELTTVEHPTGNRGIHGIEGFNSVASASARTSIAQVAADRGRAVYQSAGDNPGWWIADGAGNWTYLAKNAGAPLEYDVPAAGAQVGKFDFPDSGSPAVAAPSFTMYGVTSSNGGSKPDNPTFAFAFNTSVNGSQTNTAFPSIGVHFEGSYEPASARRVELHVISAVPGGSSLRQISLSNGADVGSGIQFANDYVYFTLPNLTSLLDITTGGITAKSGRSFIQATNNVGAIFGINVAGNAFPEIARIDSADWINLGLSGNPTGVRTQWKMHAVYSTAAPSGGTAGSGLLFFSDTNFGVFGGTGAPTLSAAQGSLYLRRDGVPYYNTDGATAWSTVGYTDEQAQDAVGTILTDSSRIDFTYNDGAPSITADLVAASVANSYLANMDQSTIKGRAAGAGTGAPTDLTATQATAILNNMVGDSGAGGTKGLVPAPAAGDAAAAKFLKADGTWTAPAGGGDALTTNPLSQFAATTSAQLRGVMSDESGTGALLFANGAIGDATGTTLTLNQSGLHLLDSDSSHDLIINPGSNLTADRTLTVTTGDADRTLTMTGNASITGTNTGDQTITLTGDVTGSGTGSFAATIATAAVTLAKMADLAQDAFIIRTTASTGVPETATCTAAARTVLDDATVSAMVDTLGGAAAEGTGALVRKTSPTIVTPTIASLTNMQHTHQNAAGGGTLDAAAIAAGTMATARLGSGTASAYTFLAGDQTYKNAAHVIAAAVVNQTLSAATISTTETVFGATVTIPASTLIAGVRYRLWLYFLHTSANTITSEIRLRKDNASGTILFSTGLLQVGSVTGVYATMVLDIIGTAAAGASVNVYTSVVGRSNHNTLAASGHTAQPVALATNADLVLAPTGDFSGNTAGHSIELVGYTLERLAA